MLVLSRNKEESIIIGDDITITVVDIRFGQVRIGIDAPKNVSVHRREVYDRIQCEQAAEKQATIPTANRPAVKDPYVGR